MPANDSVGRHDFIGGKAWLGFLVAAGLILIGLDAFAGTRSIARGDSTVIDNSGTAYITRIIPLPATVSPEAQSSIGHPGVYEDGGVPPSLAQMRTATDAWQARMGKIAETMYPVHVVRASVGGIPVRVVTPLDMPKRNVDRVLINLHGGGFNLDAGSLTESVPIAYLTRTKVIAVLYRLAPEHPFPAAVDDVVAVYKQLLQSYAPQHIAIYGTSAGATLTAEVAVSLKKLGLPLPAALGIFSGFGDFNHFGDSAAMYGLGGLTGVLPPGKPPLFKEYVYTTNPEAPDLSPLYANLHGLPPTLFITSERDMFLSSTTILQRAFLRAGVDARLVVFEALAHGFWDDPRLPESGEAYGLMAQFFDEQLAQQPIVSMATPASTLAARLDPSARATAQSAWVSTWGAAMVAADSPGAGPGLAPESAGLTLREIVHTSAGGPLARVWLSNRFGTKSLRIGAAHIALTARESDIRGGTDHALTFDSMGSVVIPPGADVVSDPVALVVPPLTDIDVSIFFPGQTLVTTEHGDAQQISYVAKGDAAAALSLAGKSTPIHSWYLLSGVDVYAPGDSTVIAFGDSITDGWQSTPNENRRWTDDLASRLASNAEMRKEGVLGVVNVGISGNRVLRDGWGPNGVSRIGRDILTRDHARYVIVLEGINDIGRFAMNHRPYGDLTRRLEAGIAQIAAQAHLHGLKVIGGTLTPYQGSAYYSPDGDQVRQAVNEWIRTSRIFDGVADFDKALRDPQEPLKFLARFDSGDHLHPDDAGYKAMADAVDLRLFSEVR